MDTETFLRENSLVLLQEDSDSAIFAAANPKNFSLVEALEFLYQKKVQLQPLDQPLSAYHLPAEQVLHPNAGHCLLSESVARFGFNSKLSPAAALIEYIVFEAVKAGASDIHLDPTDRGELLVRFRINGILSEFSTIAVQLVNEVVNRIKIISTIEIDKKLLPSSGHISYVYNDRKIYCRSSIINGISGESVVIRIHNSSLITKSFSDLGMTKEQETEMLRLISIPYGLIIVSGSTGSGKSTTFYTALSYLYQRLNKKIITIEEPIEIYIEGLNQIQVGEGSYLKYEDALRAVLRQSPQVLAIGEIRDEASAQFAFQAAVTGHLVLATLHAGSVQETLKRLHHMGVQEYQFKAALKVVVYQSFPKNISRCTSPSFVIKNY